jgi:PAS domain S-box-containing protein
MNIGWQKTKYAWKRLSIESRGLIAVAIPLTCLFATVIAYTLLSRRMIELYMYVDHTNQILAESQNALNTYVIWSGMFISIGGSVFAMQLLKELSKEMRSREIRLLESRNLIQAIMANVVDGVLIINSQGKIETFNGAAIKMFGYQHYEVMGWPWQKLLSPEAESTQKLLNYGHDLDVMNSESIWQAMGQRKEGEWFPIEISVNNIALDDDRIVIIRDITDRQQAAAKLRAKAVQMLDLNESLTASNQSLLQINHELDQFAYITSHDLKAPLRAIASLSEWIEEDLDKLMPAETRSQMHLLRGRVYRMQALLDGLLEYSQAGRRKFSVTSVDVNSLLTKVIQSLTPPDTFTIKIESPMPIFDTREQPLQQVFSHLMDNAIRHHFTKTGIVIISVVDQGDRYEFAVADDGEGIEPQFQEKIYTIFQTLKARDHQENIGAGLAIVKKIVVSEGGVVSLESTFGKGSTFRFTWLKQPIIKEKALAGQLE